MSPWSAKPSQSPRRLPLGRLRRPRRAIWICRRWVGRWPASGAGSSCRPCWPPCISVTTVNLITPRYKSEARILVDGRENVFLRPNGERNEERSSLDAEAVTSQVQLLLSRDLAPRNHPQEQARRAAGIRSGAAGPVAAEVDAGVVRHRPRSVHADPGRAGAGRLLRALHRLCGRQIPRHRHRIPVVGSRTRGERRQFDSRRLSGAAAECAAGAGQGSRPSGCRARSTICAGRWRRPKRGSRISAPSPACSSAPTTPRCPTSSWASSTRS